MKTECNSSELKLMSSESIKNDKLSQTTITDDKSDFKKSESDSYSSDTKKKQVFHVHHKNEKITIFVDKEKHKYRTLYKCIYCQEIFYSINRFDSHMRKHVIIFF